MKSLVYKPYRKMEYLERKMENRRRKGIIGRFWDSANKGTYNAGNNKKKRLKREAA